ncbi:hypothetical protein GCM10023091_24580 [Ravibacter arvi]|uniref:4-O-methyl-glucuronoyl methylesterase-like domain-containing protein n=2 Tax=Ravibacter arvi TaxID=2051041 RepID=A0ABP8LZL9_9BACT
MGFLPIASEKSYDLLSYKDSAGKNHRIKSKKEWLARRKQILENLQLGMGSLPVSKRNEPVEAVFRDSLVTDRYTRYTLQLAVAENENVPAYYYVPKAAEKPFAAMLALHPTGELGKDITDGKSPRANRAYAKELAERGYAVLAPDFPGYGALRDYDFASDRYESGAVKGVFNHIRCVDFLQSRSEINPDAIGVIGHSLGGYNAIFLGAFDTRLKIVVASSGWTLFDFYKPWSEEAVKRHGGRLGPWAQEVNMPPLRHRYHLDGSLFPFDFHEAVAAIAPRTFFSNSPLEDYFSAEGVKTGMKPIQEVYRLMGAVNNVHAEYPSGGHDFPTAQRKAAYHLIDTRLNHQPLDHMIE